jgi:hypothetical protein
MEESLLIRYVTLYALVSAWRRRKGETHARVLARLTVVRRWARAHDVRVNSPPKSGPKAHRPTARRFSCCAAEATSSRSSTCICDRESRSSEPSSSARWRIRFLGSDLRDCSLASSSSPPRLVYLFVGLTQRVIAFNANFVRPIAVFIQLSSSRNHKSRMIPALKSYLTYLICWST